MLGAAPGLGEGVAPGTVDKQEAEGGPGPRSSLGAGQRWAERGVGGRYGDCPAARGHVHSQAFPETSPS